MGSGSVSHLISEAGGRPLITFHETDTTAMNVSIGPDKRHLNSDTSSMKALPIARRQ